MTTLHRGFALSCAAALATVAFVTPPASAAPSCVAQSVEAEHELYSTAWGHDLIAFLATHPDALATSGFDSFGELASYAARQDHADCPPDL